jgi:hypothetical protein
MATLTLQLPNLPPVEHVLKDEAVTVGRMKGNTIALDDTSVSLSHAKLTLRDGGYFLKDLNSTNGTMVNGQSVTEAQLHDGDHVKFGEVIGRFHAGVAPAMQPVNPPAVAHVPTSAASPPPSASLRPPAPRQAAWRQSRAKKIPWYPLAAVVGLAVIGLLLWRLVSKPSNPPGFPARTNLQPPSAGVKVAAPEKPPGLAPLRSTNPAVLAQISGGDASASQRLPALIQSLQSPDVQERRRAVAALNTMQGEVLPAVPALREALKDSDSEVQTWAALILVGNRVNDPAAVPILIQALHHENPMLRQVACLSLALMPFNEMEKEPVLAALTDCVSNDTNADVRSAAVSALKMVAHDSTPAGR